MSSSSSDFDPVSGPRPAPEPSLPPDQDLVLLFTALHAACDAEVVRRIGADGFGDLRPAHGYVFQHLVPGPVTISELARKLGMTAQGASKLVIELGRFGYLARQIDPTDRRNHTVSLTARGWAAIEAGRAARAAVTAQLRAALGEDTADALVASLQQLAEHTGGLRTLLARRLRPGPCRANPDAKLHRTFSVRPCSPDRFLRVVASIGGAHVAHTGQRGARWLPLALADRVDGRSTGDWRAEGSSREERW
jgi:DNA-binding MarR family transcriptional regulator